MARKRISLNDKQRMMVTENLSLAVNLSKSFAPLGEYYGVSREDLQQEASLGLCEAAMRYHPDQGAEFRTYAYDWCRKYIILGIRSAFHNSSNVDDVPDADIIDMESDDECVLKVAEMMNVLGDLERKIVRLLYGFDSDPMDFRQVSMTLNLNIRRVHQVYEKAMIKMELASKHASQINA